MLPKPLAVGLLAIACVIAAAGSAYVAVQRHGSTAEAAGPISTAPAPSPAVQETEGLVAPSAAGPADLGHVEASGNETAATTGSLAAAHGSTTASAGSIPALGDLTAESVGTTATPSASTPPSTARVAVTTVRPGKVVSETVVAEKVVNEKVVNEKPRRREPRDTPPVTRSASRPAENGPAEKTAAVPFNGPEAAAAPRPEPVISSEPPPADPVRNEPPPPPAAEFVELMIPSASVIGLQLETAVSTERANLEDRVDARVLRDVAVDGRIAIPAGTRALGAVTLVERGGKVKERARLGVRFHTLILADGTHLPIRTDAILREGDSATGESAAKIGGAAVGGAILGALMGGKKGAILGGATGAAGGTAMVLSGGRNSAALSVGSIVTVRLSTPVSIEVERR